MNTEHKGPGDESTRKVALSKRLEDFGWAVLLIAIGTIWLMPENLMPKGTWLIAAGIIMLGLNAIRYFNGIKMVGFSLVALSSPCTQPQAVDADTGRNLVEPASQPVLSGHATCFADGVHARRSLEQGLQQRDSGCIASTQGDVAPSRLLLARALTLAQLLQPNLDCTPMPDTRSVILDSGLKPV